VRRWVGGKDGLPAPPVIDDSGDSESSRDG
jgi:hypothetical protein